MKQKAWMTALTLTGALASNADAKGFEIFNCGSADRTVNLTFSLAAYRDTWNGQKRYQLAFLDNSKDKMTPHKFNALKAVGDVSENAFQVRVYFHHSPNSGPVEHEEIGLLYGKKDSSGNWVLGFGETDSRTKKKLTCKPG